jgi:16S rRNA (adenine1518-N6/adenine1519-N6)-dimethyltransferase
MPQRKFSQVFLTDTNILKKIVETAKVKEDEWVLEIGPGKGYLTEELLKAGAKVIAIEIDEELFRYLKGEFVLFLDDRLFLYNADFLKINLKELFEKLGISETKVISNIPYHITTPILEKLIYSRDYFPEIYLTVQREVAERIVAPPGNKVYGSLTVFVNLYYTPSIEFNISRFCFHPVPLVNSAFLKLLRKEEVTDRRDLERFVRRLFEGRRKKIRTLLRAMGCYNPSLEPVFSNYLDKRPEELSISDFESIFRECSSLKNKVQ